MSREFRSSGRAVPNPHRIPRMNWQGLMSLLWTCSGLMIVAAHAAEPSQTPLTSRTGDIPPPNVMITLDDSGSMEADFMPEGSFKVNGFSVTLESSAGPGDRLGFFPPDPRKAATGMLDAYVVALKTGATVYQMQMRSPDINTIFYNPDVRYRPWLKPQGTVPTGSTTGTGVYMADADPKKAKWDPFYASYNPAYIDLTLNRTAVDKNALTYRWCTAYNVCDAKDKTSTRDFYPGLFYRLKAGASVNPNLTASYDAYDVNDAANYSPTKSKKPVGRTDCTADPKICTQTEEKTNFANWFTYYRARESIAKAALTESLFGFQNKMRVGWGRINNGSATKVDGSSATTTYKVIVKGIANLDATHLNNVLTGLQTYRSTGGTPLRTALDSVGPYFDNRTDAYNPWKTTPGATTSPGNVKLGCRRSFNILTTDGYYNDSYTAAGDVNNVDSTNSYPFDSTKPGQNPGNYSPTKYLAIRPFIDDPKAKTTNSLTDVALRWYYRDLDTTVDNKVSPTDGDKAFWQHLSQFTIGIGVKGTLDASTPAAKAATIKAISDPAGTTNWPAIDTSPKKIDDLWHAAVITGGDFYSVKNGAELSSALTNIFNRAAGQEAREAGVATVASTLSTNNVKYVPQYRSGAWYGDVYAYQLDSLGNVSNTKPIWQSSTVLPAYGSRKLYTWSGSAGISFDFDTLTASDTAALTLLGSGGKDLINYLRGDASNEGSTLSFRARGGQFLGDFINSPPVYVGGLLDMAYDQISDSAQASSYRAYVNAKKNRSVGAVATGGNAGVFHLFRSSDGVETFGFLPRTGLANLATVADKTYGTLANFHRFFADGPTQEADAYIVPNGETAARWTNMLISSMGFGGKSVFAIHVPTGDPSAVVGATAVQWELNSHNDLGYVLGDIRTGHIKGGSKWLAFIGNGVYSSSGKAALLVVDMQTGAVLKSITVPTSGANGLGGVRLLRDSKQEVYAAYAGDLQGNLWRFDFGDGNDDSTWKVSFKQSAFFKATDSSGVAQAIVAAPSLVPHPQRGNIVLFGTGRLIDLADASTTGRQTFYGVWDDTALESSAADLSSPFLSADGSSGIAPYRDLLLAQTITTGSTVSGTKLNGSGVAVPTGTTYYTVSTEVVDWTVKKGWYMDLTIENGQRAIYPSQTILSSVYFSTVVPAAEAAQCEFTSGTGYNFVLDAVNGKLSSTPTFDTNGDGVVNSSDAEVAGYKSSADGVDKLLTGQDGVVDDSSTKVCLRDKNNRCQSASGNGCLVVVVNTTNTAEAICVEGPPTKTCWDESVIPVTEECPDNPSACPEDGSAPAPGYGQCLGGSVLNPQTGKCLVAATGKEIPLCCDPDNPECYNEKQTMTGRTWYRLLNPPHP